MFIICHRFAALRFTAGVPISLVDQRRRHTCDDRVCFIVLDRRQYLVFPLLVPLITLPYSNSLRDDPYVSESTM